MVRYGLHFIGRGVFEGMCGSGTTRIDAIIGNRTSKCMLDDREPYIGALAYEGSRAPRENRSSRKYRYSMLFSMYLSSSLP